MHKEIAEKKVVKFCVLGEQARVFWISTILLGGDVKKIIMAKDIKLALHPAAPQVLVHRAWSIRKPYYTLLYTMCQGAQYDSSRREAKLSKAGWLIAMMALTVLLQPRSIKPEVRPYALLVDYTTKKNQACAQDLMSLSSYIQQQCKVNTD